MLNVGDPIPLFLQLADYNPTKYVQAYVQNPAGNPIAGSPFTLVPDDATGSYRNQTAFMTADSWLFAQYLVFDDAGFTTLSTTEGGSSEVFFRALQTGDVVPLYNQLATYDPTKFVRAFVQNAAGVPISGSPFALAAVGTKGLYRNLTAVMPAFPWVHVKYAVYDDSGFTILSGANGGGADSFYSNTAIPPFSLLPKTSNIVAFVDGDDCCTGPIEDTIIQGSSRVLLIRLADVDGNPFDLTSESAIEFRMRKSDGTILSLTQLLGDITIVNAGGGQIAVELSSAETLALAPGIPSPATIKVTIGSNVTVINLTTQLSVESAQI